MEGEEPPACSVDGDIEDGEEWKEERGEDELVEKMGEAGEVVGAGEKDKGGEGVREVVVKVAERELEEEGKGSFCHAGYVMG